MTTTSKCHMMHNLYYLCFNKAGETKMKFSPVSPNIWGTDSWKLTEEIQAVRMFEVVLGLGHKWGTGMKGIPTSTPLSHIAPLTLFATCPRKLRSNIEDTEPKIP